MKFKLATLKKRKSNFDILFLNFFSKFESSQVLSDVLTTKKTKTRNAANTNVLHKASTAKTNKNLLFLIYLIYYLIWLANAIDLDNNNSPSNYLETNSNEITINYFRKSPSISNLTTIIGETVHFNCSMNSQEPFQDRNLIKYSSSIGNGGILSQFQNTNNNNNNNELKLNPTWLKADAVYDQNGIISGFKTENIIVTRKGIIAGNYQEKMKLITTNDQFQTLRISNVNVKNEGKYICREFNSQYDKLFYLNVYAGVNGLNIKFNSPSKYFRAVYTGTASADQDDDHNLLNAKNLDFTNTLTSSISIKENDELTINCTVNSSKPAANISIWVVPNHRSTNDDETKKLEVTEFHTIKNRDLTLKSVAIAKLIVNRLDSHKAVTCIAENTALDEKWESKRILNVLYGPKCSKYQKTIYNTGINQSIELECRMTDANPPYLDFTWHFSNNQGSKDRTRSNGFVSRINWTPRNENDFGEIKCTASNGLDIGECKMQLQLGGPPNPPHDCYHKENNKTIIIECKPGFDQGDPEVYFYLLKKKFNGVLVEYARKRDSCSFLISNLILEEHMNDFFVYSSNKYGNNKELATRIIIENKDFLIKNSNKLQDVSNQTNKRLTVISGIVCLSIFVLFFICCILVKCKKSSKKLPYNHQTNHVNLNGRHSSLNPLHYQEPYKYNSHYTSKSSIHVDSSYHQSLKKTAIDDKANYTSNGSTSSEYDQEINNAIYDNKKSYTKVSSKTIRSPSLINNIQDLDMSPKSKRRSLEKPKESLNGCTRSLMDETTETDSDNYIEFSRTKIKAEQFCELQSISDDQKIDYYCPLNNNFSTVNSHSNSKLNGNVTNPNGIVYTISKSIPKVNVWYGNNSDSNDEYGLSSSTDTGKKSAHNSSTNNTNTTTSTINNNIANIANTLNTIQSKKLDFKNMNGLNLNGKNENEKEDFDEDREEKKLFHWPKNNLPMFSNETISLDVDDEKVVGILV